MRHTYRYSIGLLMVLVCMLLRSPVAVLAEPMPPDLIVTLHDVQGVPLAGITVQVRASANGPLLAQAVTDPSGAADIAGLTVDRVVVVVSGVLSDGIRLLQPGQDAHGIALLLGPPPTRLDLRVDANGMVLPDPATMIDPMVNGPSVATRVPVPGQDDRIVFPTSATFVPHATTAVAAETPPPAPPSAPVGAAVAAPTNPATLNWLGWAIVGLVLMGLVVLVWSLTRQRAP